MRVMIAGISGDTQYVKSTRSHFEIEMDSGDVKTEKASGRGDVSRRLVCYDFLESDYDAILMLDMDMLHPPDILLRLKKHNLDMVTGHYYARNSRNIHSIWCWPGNGKWPFPPVTDVPRSGLHKIGMTGMGNVLIKREVVQAVQDYLPKGDEAFGIGPASWLTGDNRSLGSDFRFFGTAQMLGFTLWGDASIESKHATVFWLGHKIADALKDDKATSERLEEYTKQFIQETGMDTKVLEMRIEQLEARKKDYQQQLELANRNADFLNRQLIAVNAVIADERWLLEQFKKTQEQFPEVPESERTKTLEHRTGMEGISEKEVKAARTKHLQDEAAGFVADLQAIKNDENPPK